MKTEYTQLEKDLIHHATVKCGQTISDTASLTTSNIEHIVILHGVASRLLTATLCTILGPIPVKHHAEIMNEVFREIFKQTKAALKTAVDTRNDSP